MDDIYLAVQDENAERVARRVSEAAGGKYSSGGHARTGVTIAETVSGIADFRSGSTDFRYR